jgi:hypothetical protein
MARPGGGGGGGLTLQISPASVPNMTAPVSGTHANSSHHFEFTGK